MAERFIHYNVHRVSNYDYKHVQTVLNAHADKGYELFFTRANDKTVTLFFRREFDTFSEREAFRKQKESRTKPQSIAEPAAV